MANDQEPTLDELRDDVAKAEREFDDALKHERAPRIYNSENPGAALAALVRLGVNWARLQRAAMKHETAFTRFMAAESTRQTRRTTLIAVVTSLTSAALASLLTAKLTAAPSVTVNPSPVPVVVNIPPVLSGPSRGPQPPTDAEQISPDASAPRGGGDH